MKQSELWNSLAWGWWRGGGGADTVLQSGGGVRARAAPHERVTLEEVDDLAMATYLLKTEPSDYCFADLQKAGTCRWDGVSNAAALIAMRSMRKGDEVRVSTPVNTASCRSKPLILRPNAGRASRIASIA